jgi:hypothetical protein
LADSSEKPAGTKLNAEQKAAATHVAAMEIIDAEVSAREKKTERLRRLREGRQAAEPAPPEKKPAKARRK